MIGGLYAYLREADPERFQPMNANFGLVPPAQRRISGKRERRVAQSARALAAIEAWAEAREPVGARGRSAVSASALERRVEDFLEYLRTVRHYSANTIDGYGRDLARWGSSAPNIWGRPRPTSTGSRQTTSARTSPGAPGGAREADDRAAAGIVAGFFRHACREGWSSRNPAQTVAVPAGVERCPP